MRPYLHAFVITVCLLTPQQWSDTVSITLSPDTPVIILPRSQAEQEFKQLCADATDDRRLRALAVALNPMPDWVQYVMNGDASVCQRNPKPIVIVPIEKQGGEQSKPKEQLWNH